MINASNKAQQLSSPRVTVKYSDLTENGLGIDFNNLAEKAAGIVIQLAHNILSLPYISERLALTINLNVLFSEMNAKFVESNHSLRFGIQFGVVLNRLWQLDEQSETLYSINEDRLLSTFVLAHEIGHTLQAIDPIKRFIMRCSSYIKPLRRWEEAKADEWAARILTSLGLPSPEKALRKYYDATRNICRSDQNSESLGIFSRAYRWLFVDNYHPKEKRLALFESYCASYAAEELRDQ